MECSSDITCHMPDASDGSNDDNPTNGNSGSDPPLGLSDVLVYFEILANQGLQGLEVEHSSMLERSMMLIRIMLCARTCPFQLPPQCRQRREQ
jgi:hypothetical protein